ncbi:hypothetical protein ACSYDW_08100 [Paeniglutamicibacter sp. R2-26]|uniref:hypothetical protein n=1 Tax=Paeniglutamicibacter sp. R2-26 TaxID=3144417 RepID=UPI003EE756EA
MERHPVDSTDHALKALLHEAFDSQIPNYGSYNLVAASGTSGSSGLKVVGYRREPAELIVCPLNPQTLEPSERAVAVNNTNVSHVALISDGSYEVGTSTGRVYRFNIPAHPTLDMPAVDGAGVRRGRVDQAEDAADFAEFMDIFMDLLERVASESD